MMPKIISRSMNISLYPALVSGRKGELVCAWYEYTSPHEPARSDIWVSILRNGAKWVEPLNISGGLSYNNGPNLLSSSSGHYLLAWHSWRDPGKEPFTLGGDVCNIFLSRSHDSQSWSEPVMAFQGLSNTEYATLVQGVDGIFRMFFIHRDSKSLCVSKSKNGFQWGEPKELPGVISHGKYPDVALGPDNTFYLVFVGKCKEQSIWLATSKDGKTWSEPQPVEHPPNDRLTRPKISIDLEGKIWLACHSETWGSYVARYGVKLAAPRLEITVGSNKTPGNFCWALNAVEIICKRNGAVKFFTFGPEVFPRSRSIVRVTERDCLYKPEKGYGFDGPVDSLLRELGDEITRAVFYSEEPRKFIVDLPKGEYDIKIIYSSWIASTPGTFFQFNADVLYAEQPDFVSDSVFVFCLNKGKCTFSQRVNPDTDFDNNRPSKIIHTSDGKKYLTWTKYGPKSIDVVWTSFSGLN